MNDRYAHYRLIVDASDDAIITKSLEGVISSWNTGAQRMFGYTAAEAVGQPILIIIPRELHKEEMEILRRLRTGSGSNITKRAASRRTEEESTPPLRSPRSWMRTARLSAPSRSDETSRRERGQKRSCTKEKRSASWQTQFPR